MKYEVIEYDVWGNKNDGFWVNQGMHTGIIVDIDPLNDSDKQIVSKLKEHFGLKQGLPVRNFIIDGLGQAEFSIYVDYQSRRLGYVPVCELQPTERGGG